MEGEEKVSVMERQCWGISRCIYLRVKGRRVGEIYWDRDVVASALAWAVA